MLVRDEFSRKLGNIQKDKSHNLLALESIVKEEYSNILFCRSRVKIMIMNFVF